MRFIKDLSIRNKLLLIALIPLLALLYFLGLSIQDKIAQKNTMEQVHEEVLRAEAYSDLIHQIQQERGYSQEYLLARGQDSRGELFNHREQTDKALIHISELNAGTDGRNVVRQVKSELTVIRNGVNAHTLAPAAIQQRLATIILDLLDKVNQTAENSKIPEIKALLNSHIHLIYGKEYFGALRAKLSEILLAQSFSQSMVSDLATLKGRYEMNLERFSQNTAPQLKELYEQELADAGNLRARETIETMGKISGGSFPITYEAWWSIGVSYLNSLKRIEDQSTLLIRQTVAARQTAISGSMTQSIIIAIVLIALITAVLFLIISTLVSSILHLKHIADQVTVGDLRISVNVDTKDEIGSLASSFNQLIAETREYARCAEVIGGGDYSPEVKVRSEADTLGLSLNKMKDDLKKLAEENETRTWLLTGNSELNDQVRGEKDARQLAQDIITQLAGYLQAQIGAIYLLENGRMVLTGSYAS